MDLELSHEATLLFGFAAWSSSRVCHWIYQNRMSKHKKQEQQWQSAALELLERIRLDRQRMIDLKSNYTYQLDREEFIELFDWGKRIGIKVSHPVRQRLATELLHSVQHEWSSSEQHDFDSGNNETYEALPLFFRTSFSCEKTLSSDGLSWEDVLFRCPELTNLLPREVRKAVRRHLRSRTRSHLFSMFRYLFMRSGIKLAITLLIIPFSATYTWHDIHIKAEQTEKCESLIARILQRNQSLKESYNKDHWFGPHDPTLFCDIGNHILTMAATWVMTSATQGLISRLGQEGARWYRRIQKQQLYVALSKLPATFYDFHSAADVEQIVYYVDDLEGIDVQVFLHLVHGTRGILRVIALSKMLRSSSKVGSLLLLSYVMQNAKEWLREYITTLLLDDTDMSSVHKGDSCLSSRSSSQQSVGFSVLLENMRTFRAMNIDQSLWKSFRLIPEEASCGSSRMSNMLCNVQHFLCHFLQQEVSCLSTSTFGAVWSSMQLFIISILFPSFNSIAQVYQARTLLNECLAEASSLPMLTHIISLQASKAHVLCNILDYTPQERTLIPKTPEEPSCTEEVGACVYSGSIVFSNVTFAYPTRPDIPVLNHSNLTLPLGSFCAIQGPNGRGKSTLLLLLCGVYTPQQGSLALEFVTTCKRLVDTLSPEYCIEMTTRNFCEVVKEFHVGMLSSVTGYVPQIFIQLPGSIMDNVICARDGYGQGDVIRACKQAGLHRMISSLPEGYHTKLGAKSYSLSQGQAQRLSLARALLTRPRILLLDEPTSALDKENELHVTDFLHSFVASKSDSTMKLKSSLTTRSVSVPSYNFTGRGDLTTEETSLHCIPRTVICATHSSTVIRSADYKISL